MYASVGFRGLSAIMSRLCHSQNLARDSRLYIHNLVKRDPLTGLAEDVRKGLSAQPKRFLPKYFYDELGSQLFEAICLLPEYYLTRAENEILERYADEIVAAVDGQKTLVEMGSGSASKTRLIIEALCCDVSRSLLFMPVDISATALESSSRILLAVVPAPQDRSVRGRLLCRSGGARKETANANARALSWFKHQQLRSRRSATFSARDAQRAQQRRRAFARRGFEKRSGDSRSGLQRRARRDFGVQS